MLDKWKHGGSWWIRLGDGTKLNMNTETAADTILGMGETIGELEHKLHRRAKRAAKKQRNAESEGGLED